MFFNTPDNSTAQVTIGKALRHLIVFQIKLAADAARDLLLSPLSVLVFALDAIRRPALEDSLYLKLMLVGRRSDQIINLFDEQKDAGHFTVDQAVEELEEQISSRRKDNTRNSGGDSEADDVGRHD